MPSRPPSKFPAIQFMQLARTLGIPQGYPSASRREACAGRRSSPLSSRITRRLDGVPHLTVMPTIKTLTALALARAMQAGTPDARGLAARMHACLDNKPSWCKPLAERCAQMPRERWRRLSVRTLASLIEEDIGFAHAWLAHQKPGVRRYILRVRQGMGSLPLGLHRCQLPYWPNTGILGPWLGVSAGSMWRLTRPSAWQRRMPLGEQHYRCLLLPKRTGGWRLLEVPHPYLMRLQRQLLDHLLDRIPAHEAAHGYVRERSVVHHAQAHAGQAVILKFDLQDFFTSVRASRVHALFHTLGYPDSVARELTALCTTATPEPVLRRLHQEGQLPWHRLQQLREPHLPQGAPSSPALANLCAFRLDLRLDGLAHALDARYTRYADDIVISGGTGLRASYQRIAQWVARIASEEGFALNFRKSRCQTIGSRQTVCNIVVNQHPNLLREEFDRLKAILHNCVRHGPASQNRDAHPQWQMHLKGRLDWASQLNPGKAERLQRLYARIDWKQP